MRFPNPLIPGFNPDPSVVLADGVYYLVTSTCGTALVLIGVRPLGLTQSFSPLGRETFITPVSWAGGWPQPEPVLLAPRDAVEEEVFDFADPSALEDLGWLAVRTTPESVASVRDGRLAIIGRAGLDDAHPHFVGRRQRHLTATVSATVDASSGAGGLAARYDEDHWICLEVCGTAVTASAQVAGLAQSWQATVLAGDVELRMDMTPPPPVGFNTAAMGGDRIRLLAAKYAGHRTRRALLDGGDLRILHRPGHRPVRVRGNGELRQLPLPRHRDLMDRIRVRVRKVH